MNRKINVLLFLVLLLNILNFLYYNDVNLNITFNKRNLPEKLQFIINHGSFDIGLN